MDTVVLVDDKDQVLVDCGTPNILPVIEDAFEKAGLRIQDLTGIVITHQDQDHIGSLAAVKRKAPNAKVYASEAQSLAISGKEKPMRLIDEEAEYEKLSEDQKKTTPTPESLWPKVECTEVDVLVKDGDLFPWCGGTEIIFTEGHMPGHISLYVQETKTFIAGDAMNFSDDGKAHYPEKFTYDIQLAKKNLADVSKKYDIREIVCYHGGIWRGDDSKLLQNME